jgi:hypothetical protein
MAPRGAAGAGSPRDFVATARLASREASPAANAPRPPRALTAVAGGGAGELQPHPHALAHRQRGCLTCPAPAPPSPPACARPALTALCASRSRLHLPPDTRSLPPSPQKLTRKMHAPWYNTFTSHYREAEAMQEVFEPLLARYGVDVMFFGWGCRPRQWGPLGGEGGTGASAGCGLRSLLLCAQRGACAPPDLRTPPALAPLSACAHPPGTPMPTSAPAPCLTSRCSPTAAAARCTSRLAPPATRVRRKGVVAPRPLWPTLSPTLDATAHLPLPPSHPPSRPPEGLADEFIDTVDPKPKWCDHPPRPAKQSIVSAGKIPGRDQGRGPGHAVARRERRPPVPTDGRACLLPAPPHPRPRSPSTLRSRTAPASSPSGARTGRAPSALVRARLAAPLRPPPRPAEDATAAARGW